MGRRAAPAVESVDRAIRMLEVLGRHGSGASLDELVGVEGRDGSIAGPGRVGLMTKGNDQASFGTFEVLDV